MMNEADAGLAEHQPGHDQRRVDPRYLSDDERKPAAVWAESQALREVLDLVLRKQKPDFAGRDLLLSALKKQLPTLLLYRDVLKNRDAQIAAVAEATLYLIVFPGEGRDRTGIKELNDKVLGYEYCSKFIRQRKDAIDIIFNSITPLGPAFNTVGQDYKTATILAVGKTRQEFAAKLVDLDAALKNALNQVLDDAERDKDTPQSRKAEIRAVRRAINKPNYRFDFIFGASTWRVTERTPIDIVFLLVTEALKAAGVARFTAKANAVMKALRKSAAYAVAKRFRTNTDPANLDARGKQFRLSDFMRTSAAAQEIRTVMSTFPSRDDVMLTDYTYILVNHVWTFSFVMFDPPDENRLIANPDVVRDARKRALVPPLLKYRSGRLAEGNKVGFPSQVQLLELWLVAINVLDLIKDFIVPEFRSTLVRYHDAVSAAWDDVADPGGIKDPGGLERVLTRDLRPLPQPLSVQGRASEFQFYSYTSDHPDRIFFVMDVRDLGVDLMVPYELSNDQIQLRKLGQVKLMEETFWASDPINRRKRATYQAVVEVFKCFHAASHPDWQRNAVRAFGEGRAGSAPMPAFPQSIQIMMGGDELFVAAHPAYAGREAAIIKELDSRRYRKIPLNIRTAVVYSSAKKAPPATPSRQREFNIKAHDQSLALAGEAPETLKGLERTHRRIERLIDKLALNDKKKHLAAPYRKELEQLGLMKLYARAKHFKAMPLSRAKFRVLMGALKKGAPQEAQKTGNFDLIDFGGKEVNLDELIKAAQKLDERVQRELYPGNYHQEPPAVRVTKYPHPPKVPEWIKVILLPDRLVKLIEEWLEDDGQKNTPGSSKVHTA